MNQKAKFSRRVSATLAPGTNAVTILNNSAWLAPEPGASLAVSFSVEVAPSALASANVRIGAHSLDVTPGYAGTLVVNVINDGAANLAATVIAHVESFMPWPDLY